MAKFDFSGFIRECYLRSEPSVDLDNVTSDNPIDCCKHRLSTENYHAICVDYELEDADGKTLDHEILCACNMWMLQSGPQLYDNSKVV